VIGRIGLCTLALAAFIVGGESAAATLPVASAQEIVAGAQSCLAATSATTVDEQKLKADGWHDATMSSSGKAVATPLTFYGKGGLLLSLDRKSGKGLCMISGRIKNADAFGIIGSAMDKALGTAGTGNPNAPNTAYWFPADHIVQLKLTGTSDAPAVRIAVGINPAEKK
jgi:hypothetical protein